MGEVGCRISRGSPNPLIHIAQTQKEFLFEPNTIKRRTSSIEGEFDYMAHHNKYGYRGKDFEMPKPEGALRVLAVGDSFTYGVGSEEQETIPSLIEKDLKKFSSGVEVINAGIGGTSPITHYVNLRDLHLKYEPDVVLLLFDLTDLWDDWHSERNAVLDAKGEIVRFDPMFINGQRSWWVTAVNYSAFCKWINDKIVRTVAKIKLLGFKQYAQAVREKKKAKAVIINSQDDISDQAVLEYDGLLMMRGKEKRNLINQQWSRTERYLLKIKSLLDQRNIPFIIAMYPHGIYVGKNEWGQGRLTWGFEPNKQYVDRYPFDLVGRFASEHDIPFINTLDDFLNWKAPEIQYFFEWDGHMTSAGNRLVAKSIVQSQKIQDATRSAASAKIRSMQD